MNFCPPHSVIVDEAAFVTDAFFTQFLKPLMAVKRRNFALITTPPPKQGFFSDFITAVQKANTKFGDSFWTVHNHSLICSECLENGTGARCLHHLHFVPPWKSVLRFESLLRVTPARQRQSYAIEVLGVVDDREAGYLNERDVQRLFDKDRTPAPLGCDRLWVAMDPGSHSCSWLGLTALVGDVETGQVVVVGVANVSVDRADIKCVQKVIETFLAKVRRVPGLDSPVLCPIIETNSSEVVARTYLNSFHKFPPVHMPFTEEIFDSQITPHVGVVTTQEVKLSALTTTQTILSENAIRIASNCVNTDGTCFRPNALSESIGETLETLQEQLVRFKDNEDGTVSGKGGGQQDDCGMSCLLAIYWRRSVLSAQR